MKKGVHWEISVLRGERKETIYSIKTKYTGSNQGHMSCMESQSIR